MKAKRMLATQLCPTVNHGQLIGMTFEMASDFLTRGAGEALVYHHLVNPDDPRMLQRDAQGGLLFEATRDPSVSGVLGMENLEGHIAALLGGEAL